MSNREELIEEAMGVKGMIAEIQAKARFWKFKAQNERDRQLVNGEPVEPTDELLAEMNQAAAQMERDLAKYSNRLREIFDELQYVS